MDSYFDLELTISDNEIYTSNSFIGLGGLLVTLEENVSFELGNYGFFESKIIEKEWHSARKTFVKPENFTQYVRVFGPQFNQESVNNIIQKAFLDSKYFFLRPYSSEGKQGVEIVMSLDYTINFNR